MTSELNVAEVERWASALGGAALAVYGITPAIVAGAMIAASGGALIARGATGHCPVYAVADLNTADTAKRTRGLRSAVTRRPRRDGRDDRPAAPTSSIRFWRNLENLPQVHARISCRCGRLTIAARTGSPRRRPAERSNGTPRSSTRFPNKLIAWQTARWRRRRSAPARSVSSRRPETAAHRCTSTQYHPPAGQGRRGGRLDARSRSDQTIQEDLRRFKQLMETGEIPTTEGQPRGGNRFQLRLSREVVDEGISAGTGPTTSRRAASPTRRS